MKNKFLFIALFPLCTLLQGCFGIEEKILIHKDGSGTYTFSMDLTEALKDMTEMVQKLDKAFKNDSDTTAGKTPQDLQNETYKKLKEDSRLTDLQTLNSIKGISNSREFVDTANGLFITGISFDFTDVNALNKGLVAMLSPGDGKNKKQGNIPPATYGYKNGVLTRELSKATTDDMFKDMKLDAKTEAMFKKMFKDFKYTITVQSDADIKKVTAPGGVISQKGKKTSIEYNLLEESKEVIKARMRSDVQVY